MDYIVGSVAALISGNVTPNRPKVFKRALTPMKHQPSPNVTPKSESVTDRSIFLSPTMQKKKAIVKKSPKRIFQNPDLDANSENDGHSSTPSPKTDKVKKHLKDELDSDIDSTRFILSPKSPKQKTDKFLTFPSKNQLTLSADSTVVEEIQVSNESTPKKKKKKPGLVFESVHLDIANKNQGISYQDNKLNLKCGTTIEKSMSKNKKKICMFTVEVIDGNNTKTTGTVKESNLENVDKSYNKKKSNKMTKDTGQDSNLHMKKYTSVNKENESQLLEKKNKKCKKSALKNVFTNSKELSKSDENLETEYGPNEHNLDYINPNAITNQDTDSEHESDDDIQSENEENNRTVLDTGSQESSEDEEDNNKNDKNTKKSNDEDVKGSIHIEEEVKRTLFVGNVPLSSKCKKEIKRIFSKYGEIETIRIRTVPVKDGRVTPKLAVIKNELHPDRSTVNVYIKYSHPSSVKDALVENNRVLNEHHLRVAPSDVTGSEHDPKCSVFVGNIPFALEDEALRAKFDKCGEIESVRIVRDRKTNAGKGFGYVNFASKDGVELALALTEEDLTLKNRILRVKRCTQPTTNQQGRQQSNQGRPHSYRRRQQNYHGRKQNQDRHFNNYRGANDRVTPTNRFGRNQFGNEGDHGTDGKSEGAYRRIMNKRKPQETTDGPPQKRQKSLNEPNKEKKLRKEFVGVTADKKKFQKRKLNKDQKKKRALSEILTKQRQ